MGSFRVVSEGPLTRPLSGTVHVGGAKNSALKLMAGALLAPGRSVIHNVPNILDVAVMGQLLRQLGCTVEIAYPGDADPTCEPTSGRATIDVPEELEHKAPYELVRRLRASIAVLGPLVARCHRASVALPGGDAIGSRGLDMHILGLQELGAVVRIEHGQVVAEVPGGLREPTSGSTSRRSVRPRTCVMAAVMAQGTTVIDNVAREPEIIDLCQMLVAMGARIDGVSTSTLEIEGVDRLNPVEHTTVTDRIVTGTWVFANAIAGGDLHISGGVAHHLDIVLDKLVASGAEIEQGSTGFTVSTHKRLTSFDVATLPYPGFPTDLQPFAMALASVSSGTAMITENVFEARFMFAQELARLGADLRTDGHHAVVRGVPMLSGAPVVAHDIRAGAALVLAGLAAQGTTVVAESQHIDRGYPWFAEALASIGAEVSRLPD